MKILSITLCGLLFSVVLFAEDAKEAWSEPVNGLSARLSLERDVKSPFLNVYIELRNLEDVMGNRRIRFSPDKLSLKVQDAEANPLSKMTGSYDGISPSWDPLLLPYRGTLRFQISFPGIGYSPEKDKTIIDLGASQCWSVPEGKRYFLSGSFTIIKEERDHPYMDWSGVLNLPAIPIPMVVERDEPEREKR